MPSAGVDPDGLEGGRPARHNGCVATSTTRGKVEVISVHGLWNRGPELFALRRNLERALGCAVRQFRYDTRAGDLDEVAAALADFVGDRAPVVHLVGHSLGGLVILNALASGAMPPGRVVLLGAPVNGSVALAGAARLPFGPRLIGGLLPRAIALAPYAAPLDRDVGVVAGEVPLGMGRLVARFRGPNDGTVLVAETKLPGCPHLRVRASHTGLLFSAAAARAAAGFLRSGAFVP